MLFFNGDCSNKTVETRGGSREIDSKEEGGSSPPFFLFLMLLAGWHWLRCRQWPKWHHGGGSSGPDPVLVRESEREKEKSGYHSLLLLHLSRVYGFGFVGSSKGDDCFHGREKREKLGSLEKMEEVETKILGWENVNCFWGVGLGWLFFPTNPSI